MTEDLELAHASRERLLLQAEWELAHGGDLFTVDQLKRAAAVIGRFEHLLNTVYANRDFEVIEGAEVWCELSDALHNNEHGHWRQDGD